jgi:hypothetical protein
VRKASSLSARQWKGSPAFRGSRAAADRFGEAARLSSRVYQRVQKEARSRELYGYLKGWALLLLKEGRDRAQVEGLLLRYLLRTGCVEIQGVDKSKFKSQKAKRESLCETLCPVVIQSSPDTSGFGGQGKSKRGFLCETRCPGAARSSRAEEGKGKGFVLVGSGKNLGVFENLRGLPPPAPGPPATHHSLLAWRNWATEKIRRYRCVPQKKKRIHLR